jgi:hypothetical protein
MRGFTLIRHLCTNRNATKQFCLNLQTCCQICCYFIIGEGTATVKIAKSLCIFHIIFFIVSRFVSQIRYTNWARMMMMMMMMIYNSKERKPLEYTRRILSSEL